MDKNRIIVFWGLCALIVSLVVYGVRENRALAGNFSVGGESEEKQTREKQDLESAGRTGEPETVTITFDYKDAQ